MVVNQIIKQELQTKLEQLPPEKLGEVLDFVSFLLSRQKLESQPESRILDPDQDPLLDFIGAVSHGSLAQNIDEDIYGT